MAQIFISHSAKDTKPLTFLNRAFATTNVQAKHEEIEAIAQGKRTAAQIKQDIAQSNAIMVVLGPNAERLKHTRDWIVWESGNAAAGNKDVWVLESSEDSQQLSVVIPHLRHYVCFGYEDPWLIYLRQIISSYDDSNVAAAGLAGATIGAAIGEGPGFLLGGLAGLIMASNSRTRPAGLAMTCSNCHSTYSVHIGTDLMRCAVCNSRLQINLAKSVNA